MRRDPRPRGRGAAVRSLGSREPFDQGAELGDVLFSLVNVGRRMGVDAEGALRSTCRKFRDRWAWMEQAAWQQGRTIEDLSSEERETLWNEAKKRERS